MRSDTLREHVGSRLCLHSPCGKPAQPSVVVEDEQHLRRERSQDAEGEADRTRPRAPAVSSWASRRRAAARRAGVVHEIAVRGTERAQEQKNEKDSALAKKLSTLIMHK